jgi:phage terminase small subunit
LGILETAPGGPTAGRFRCRRARRVNDKQRRLVREYVKDLNGAAAARRAGYGEASARVYAHKLLHEPALKAAVERQLAARERRTLVTADRVLEEYARIAFADIRNYADWDGAGVTLRPPEELSDDDAAAIAAITPGAGGARLRLHDKKAALAALARHLGLFEQRPTADPSARIEAGRRVREMLLAQVAALAPKTPTQ